MVAFVTGSTLGLSSSSLAVIGTNGVVGDAQTGSAGERVYVNVATGDLVVQRQDEFVESQEFGQALSVLRTYNSYGQPTDGTKDGWQMNVVKTISGYTPPSNINSFTPPATIYRNDGDGTQFTFSNYDSATKTYTCKSGAGAFDTLTLVGTTWVWRNGATGVTETYDVQTQRMVSSADREGNTTYYAYDAYGRFDTITDAAGETVKFNYNNTTTKAISSLTTTTAAGTSSTVAYGYDSGNRLTSVTVTKGGQSFTTTYTYDPRSYKLTQIQFPDGSKVLFTYDSNNANTARVSKITQVMADGSQRVTTLTYQNGKTTVQDPLLNVTTLNYDTSKRLTSIVWPSTTAGQPKVSFSYTSNNQIWQQTDALNNVIEYVYDSAGRQVEQHSGTTATNGTGNTIRRTYDQATGVLTSETVYLTPDPDGAGPAAVQNGLTTTYIYNPSKTHARFVVSPQGRVTEYQYDGYGRRTAEIIYGDRQYNGSLDEASIDAWLAGADRTRSSLTQITYSVLPTLTGSLVKDVTRFATVDSVGNGVADGTESITEYIYDPAGRLLYTIAADRRGTAVSGGDVLGATHYTYDELGRVLTMCDAAGKLTTYSYDDARNTTTIAYANGLSTVNTYDANGRLVLSVNSGTALGTTKYWYDADGRLRMWQDTTGLKRYSLYDEASRKVADIDANGTLTEYTYDLNNQVVRSLTYATNLSTAALASLVDASGNPANISLTSLRPATAANDRKTWNLYDAGGRLVKSVDQLGYVTEIQYDGASRVTKTVRYATAVNVAAISTSTKPADAAVSPPANALDQVTRFFYDSEGRPTVTIAPDGLFTLNEYDVAGHLRHTVAFSNRGGVSTAPGTGLLVPVLPAADEANDRHTWYFYDGQDRLVALVDPDGNLTEYGYDNSGNRIWQNLHTETTIVPSSIRASTRLASLLAQAPGGQITRYTYTDLNQVDTRIDPDGTTTKYTYDATGNLVRTDRALANPDVRTRQTKVDGFGRVTSELSAAGSAALAALGPNPTTAQIDAIWARYQVAYAYDTEGRRTTMVDANGSKTVYYYDSDSRLVYTINSAGEVTQNVYTALEQLQQVIRFGTRLTSAQFATLSGGLLTAAASTTLSIANAAADSAVTYTYANGNVVVEKDANGNYTRYLYGSNNRLQYKLDSANGLTAYAYDVAGRLASTTSYAKVVPATNIAPNAATQLTAAMFTSALLSSIADASQDNVSTTVYDSLGRAAFVVSGGGSVIGRSYDANGNVTAETRYAAAIVLPSSPTPAAVQQALRPDPEHDRVCYYGYDTAGNITYKAESSGVQKGANGAVTAVLYTVTTSQYDASGNIVDRHTYANRITTPGAHTIPAEDTALDAHQRWIYDTANHVTGTAVAQAAANGHAMWAVTSSTYDKDGRLTGTTQYFNLLSSVSLGASPSQIDVAAWMRGVTSSVLDRSTSMRYDNAGRLSTSKDAAGTETTYGYDGANRLTVKTVQGLSIRTVYDALGRAVYGIDALGDVTMNTYDANGNVIAVRRYANALTSANLLALTSTSTVADVQRLVVADSANDRIERRVYDGDNRLIYSIDGLGDTTMYTYDATGKVVQVRRYAQPINLASYPASPTVANVGPLITADAANDRIEKRVYDADNRLRYVVDPAGYVSETIYDALGQVTVTVQYSTAISSGTSATVAAVRNALQSQTPAQLADTRSTGFTYDNAGLLRSTQDARGNSESYEYDALGNRVKLTNKAGSVWTYKYDAAGRMLTQTDPAVAVSRVVIDGAVPTVTTDAGVQLVTTMAYDAFGEVVTRTEASGIAGQARTTSYVYDKLGHQLQTIFPETDVYGVGKISPYTQVTYDALGNALMNRDVGGNYSYKVYDAAGRVAYDIDVAGYVTAYQRNAFGDVKGLTRYSSPMRTIVAGRPPTLADLQAFINTTDHAADRTITTRYDAAGRVVKVTEPQAVLFDTAHKLSNSGQTFTGGRTTSTVYSAFGEALKITVDGESASGTVLTAVDDTFFSYNLRGQQVARISIADRMPGAASATGYLTTMVYDAFGNVVDRIEYSTIQTFADSQFSARTGMAWSAPTSDATKRETTYKFDANNNKTEEKRVGIGFSTAPDASSITGNAVTKYVYDKLDNLLSITDAAGTTTYTYRDALGRVTAVATMPAKLKSEQIAQAFIALLGRAPEANAWNFYQAYAAVDIFRMVYASPEGQAALANSIASYNCDADTAFVKQIYQNLMGRPADTGGLASWVGRLRYLQAGTPAGNNYAAACATLLQEVIASIQIGQGQDHAMMNAGVMAALNGTPIASAQQTELKRVQVAQLYVAIFGRVPDPSGLNFYVNGSGAVGATMAQGFFDSQEGQNVFPSNTTNRELATRLYQNMYGKAPDDATLTAWINAVPSRNALGAFVVGKLNEFLAAATMTESLHLFSDKVMAGLPETADPNASLAPLSEFQLDAYGNAVVRTDYALGAQYATADGYGKSASAADRRSYAQYDASGHATGTVDAEGKSAFSAYDAFGHDVKDWRMVTSAAGAVQTVYQIRRYDELGRLVEVDDPGADRKFTYNAFGEVTLRQLNGETYEYNNYDNAGHLWRTNAGDGIDKVFLYDAWGHQTVQARSPGAASGGADFSRFTEAGNILTATGVVVRTDFAYDLLGNVVKQVDPKQYAWDIGSVSGTTLASAAMVTIGAASMATPRIDQVMDRVEYGETGAGTLPLAYVGKNRVTLEWASLAGLGAGEVRVQITCTEWIPSGQEVYPGENVVTQDFSADEVLFGASVEWAGRGAVQSINRVKISKKDADGNWVVVADRSSWDNYGTFVRVKAPADSATPVTFKWAVSGSSTWSTLTAIGRFGDSLLFLMPGTGEGTYDYRVETGTMPVLAESGSMATVNQPLRERITQLYATILLRAPDLSGLPFYVNLVQANNSSLAAIAQTFYSSTEIAQPQNADDLVRQFVTLGLGVAPIPGRELDRTFSGTIANNWVIQLVQTPRSNWGAVLAGMVAEVANYSGTDADMLRARANLANKVTVGLNYAVDDGGYSMSEARAVMTAINQGATVEQAEALGAPALFRRWATRFYVGILNRAPDAGGLQFQADALKNGATLEQIANSMYVSPECKGAGLLWRADGTALTDSEFVAQLYKIAGGRTASNADISWWTTRLAQTSRGQVIVELFNSIANYSGADTTMYTARQTFNNKVAVGLTYAWDLGGTLDSVEYALIANSTSQSAALASATSAVNAIQGMATAGSAGMNAFPVETMRRQVAQLYVAILGRSPDQNGLFFYVDRLITGAAPVDVASTMLASSEGRSLYTGYSDTQFVNAVLANLGIASPAPALTAQWVNLISQGQGRYSVAVQMIDSVVNSTDATLQTARNLFANKVSVGLAFALDMGGGNDKLQFCRDLMGMVTATNTSVAMAAAANNVAAVASEQATTTRDAMNTAVPKANADASYAQAQATYAQALYDGNAAPSTTASQQFTQVAMLYRAILLRDATYSELDFHFNSLQSGASLGLVADNSFLLSAEGKGKYPPTLTNDQFIAQVYTNVLKRDVTKDPSNPLAFWRAQLSSGQSRGQVLVNIVTAFLAYSGPDITENTNRALLRGAISNMLANDAAAANVAGYLNRASLQTAATKAAYDVALDNAATGVAQALDTRTKAGTTANSILFTQIAQMYQGGLNRPASLEDLNFYFRAVVANSGSMNDVGDAFAASAEFQQKFGVLDNAAFIDRIYRNTFGRAVDASGKAYWLGRFNAGWTRGQVMWGIVQSLANCYDNGGRDKDELQRQASFLGRVSADLAARKTDAQAALNSAYPDWLTAAVARTQQQVNDCAAERVAQAAFNANTDAKNRRQIVQLYTLLLNRGPDIPTLNKLAAQMASGTTAAQIVSAILATPEALALYPASQTDSAFFSAMWQNCFAHAPNAAENSLWTSAIRNTTRAQAVVNIAASITAYTDIDAQAKQARNELIDKVLVNMASASAGLTAMAAEAARVLAPPSGKPGPLDEIRSAGYLAGSNANTLISAQVSYDVIRTYDRWGNLLSQTDPRSNAWVTRWTYNANDQAIATQDALGNYSFAYYDILGRNVATKDANGNVNGSVYDGLGNLLAEIHADGGTVQNTYDVFGDKLLSRDAAGSVTGYGYDKLGRMTSMTRAVGIGVDNYTVWADSEGNINLNRGSPVHQSLLETYGYDELGRRIVIRDALGRVVNNYYDLRGNLESTNAGGVVTFYTWDAYNHKTSQTVGYGTGSARTERWTFDAYGRVLTHSDVATGNAGAVHKYKYDGLGNLSTLTSATTGQNLKYTYDAVSGLLVRVDDTSVAGYSHITQYAYDAAGNRTREKTSTVRLSDGVEVDVAQDNHIAYDALGRMTDIRDERYSIHYDYDKNGNRVHQHTRYWNDLAPGSAAVASTGGLPQSAARVVDFDTYSVFDVMNRAIVLDGIKDASGKVTIGWDAENKRAQGVQIGYNGAGERTWIRSYGTQLATGVEGAAYTEAYFYDAAGRLTDAWREGWQVDQRYYDAVGRILQTGGVGLNALSAQRLAAAGVSSDIRTNAYEGRTDALTRQTVRNTSGERTAQMAYEYDDAGRLSRYILRVMTGSWYANGYYYAYENWNENTVAKINVWRLGKDNVIDPNGPKGDTLNSYDANGYLVQASTSNVDGTSTRRQLVNDAAGRILTKTESVLRNASTPQGTTAVVAGTHITHTLIANGEQIGSSSDAGSPDTSTFGQSYIPVNDRSMTAGPSAYTVQAGETLQSIAKSIWGDANLWFAIAEANGFTSLTAGQVITIPPRPTVEFNDFQTFKPYEAGGILGDTTATLPTPKKSHSWFVDLLAIIAAIVVTVFVPGIGGLVGNAILASVASQAIEIAGGNQHGFSWKQVALSAVSAGVGAGMEAVGAVVNTSNATFNAVANAAIANTVAQGVGVATGLQKSFNWQGVAASAVGAGVGQAVGSALGLSDPKVLGKMSWGEQFGARLVTGLAAGGAAAIARGGRVVMQQVAVDAFGNAIGQGLVDASRSSTQSMGAGPAQMIEAGQGLRLTADQGAGFGLQLGSSWNLNAGGAVRLNAPDAVYRTDGEVPIYVDLETGTSTSPVRDPVIVTRPLPPLAPLANGSEGRASASEYWGQIQDDGARQGSFVKYAIGGTMGALAGTGYDVWDALTGAQDDPWSVANGGRKGIANFGPELFNGTANALKTSLNGYSLIAEKAGLGDGALAGFRESNTYNITPLYAYESKTEAGAALLANLAMGGAAAKYGAYAMEFDSATGGTTFANSLGIKLVSPRYQPGVVTYGDDLVPASGKWLDAATPAPIPLQVAKQLEGRSFQTFDDLRGAIWKMIAKDPELSSGFGLKSLQQMEESGYAPFAPRAYQDPAFGLRFNLHHVEPIASGGAVYDLSNIRIVSPKIHYGLHY